MKISGDWPMRGLIVLPVLLAFVGGCKDRNFVSVTGVVTLDGKPVEGAAVIFHRLEGNGDSAIAGTDAEGRFELKTEEVSGAWVGNYEVAVRKVRTEGFPAIVATKGENEDGAGALSGLVTDQTNITEIWDVPKQYGAFETSNLKIDVTPDMQPVKLELKSQ
jgi:hypothetical protein